MNIIDLILKKRAGEALTQDEIAFFIQSYVQDEIKDYQVSALLMAICLKGMNRTETSSLTQEMVRSGDTINLKHLKTPTVDKHSTGGIGDKTTLVVVPLLSACGLSVAKMSGRGLGFTGGTIDKLESFPSFKTDLSSKEFLSQVKDIHLAIVGQSETMVIADKKLYALRDVTGTVESIPLIASSIMSKKLAAGSDFIILDVKVGSGAFMKTLENARELSKVMIEIGKDANKNTSVVLSNMEQPLGEAVGNIIEVQEAINVLNGEGPADIKELSYYIVEKLLLNTQLAQTSEDAKKMIQRVISSGKAVNQFKEMVERQGGHFYALTHKPKYTLNIIATEDGYIKNIDALTVGNLAMHLGAGRQTKEDTIDLQAGVKCYKKVGDKVVAGDTLMSLYSSKPISQDHEKTAQKCYNFSQSPIQKPKLILDYLQYLPEDFVCNYSKENNFSEIQN